LLTFPSPILLGDPTPKWESLPDESPALPGSDMGPTGQNVGNLVNIKISGKWIFMDVHPPTNGINMY